MKSEIFFKKACTLMPGGVNSPVRAFRAVGETPRFIKSAKGSKIYDVDCNEYIDYVCSWGPTILGHARKEVTDAVKKAAEDGLTFGAATEKDMVRLVSSGTEAVMSAVRLARGYTGRDNIIKFAGCYHGHSDGMLVEAGSGVLTYSNETKQGKKNSRTFGDETDSGVTAGACGTSVSSSSGVPNAYASCTFVARYNDLDSVRNIIENNPDSIAGIIVEPVAANMGVILPEDGFLNGLRELCDQYGALLIFDEVITGFRLAPGGASEYYQITTDLVTLGKIVGGGMPLAAYGGRRDIMEHVSPVGNVYQAGTLSGNPIATAAGIATLRILKNAPDIYTRLDEKAALLAHAYEEKKGICVNRAGSLIGVFFSDEKEIKNYEQVLRCSKKQYADYFSYMLKNGIYIAPSPYEAMFVSDAHDDEDITKTIDIINNLKL